MSKIPPRRRAACLARIAHEIVERERTDGLVWWVRRSRRPPRAPPLARRSEDRGGRCPGGVLDITCYRDDIGLTAEARKSTRTGSVRHLGRTVVLVRRRLYTVSDVSARRGRSSRIWQAPPDPPARAGNRGHQRAADPGGLRREESTTHLGDDVRVMVTEVDARTAPWSRKICRKDVKGPRPSPAKRRERVTSTSCRCTTSMRRTWSGLLDTAESFREVARG